MASTSNTQFASRVKFHEPLDVMEVDFTHFTFDRQDQVHQFYDEIDRQLENTDRRWYFLVNYQGCSIEPTVWNDFAARGKSTNVTHGLGTVRIGAADATRDTIRERSQSDRFRANLYETREEGLVALADMRRRHSELGPSRAAGPDRKDVILEVEDISLSFGGVRAIQGVSFQVEQGEILAIIGPNGAGKTSMLNCINGFYHPQEGTITYKGQKRSRMKPHDAARQGIGRTFQNVALFKGMTTLDNIMTGRIPRMPDSLWDETINIALEALHIGPARRREIEHREFVEQIIDFLEIQSIRKIPVGRLPYGMQKRVELARALAMEPELLLLDEPMAGMNLEEKQDMSRFILDVNDQFGTTVALIEHDMSVVMDLSNFVVVLDHGVKISEGPPGEVQTDPLVIRAYLGVA